MVGAKAIAGSLLLVISAATSAAGQATQEEAACTIRADVEKLLKDKQRYDQKVVCAVGRVHLQFEGDSLASGAGEIWVNYYEPPYTKQSVERERERMEAWKRKYQDQCVVIRGRFNLAETGHFGLWPAGLDKLETISSANLQECVAPIKPSKGTKK